jgi:hypothetical protein
MFPPQASLCFRLRLVYVSASNYSTDLDSFTRRTGLALLPEFGGGGTPASLAAANAANASTETLLLRKSKGAILLERAQRSALAAQIICFKIRAAVNDLDVLQTLDVESMVRVLVERNSSVFRLLRNLLSVPDTVLSDEVAGMDIRIGAVAAQVYAVGRHVFSSHAGSFGACSFVSTLSGGVESAGAQSAAAGHALVAAAAADAAAANAAASQSAAAAAAKGGRLSILGRAIPQPAQTAASAAAGAAGGKKQKAKGGTGGGGSAPSKAGLAGSAPPAPGSKKKAGAAGEGVIAG